MKKLSPDEFEQLPIKGRGRSSYVFNSIVNLKAGEAILIEQKDWKRKASPSTLVRYIEKKHKMKFTCGSVAGGQGWAVKRIDGVVQKPVESAEKINETERLQLKSELVIFYLGRMAFHKIEKIEDSLKACVGHFWKADSKLVQELFHNIIKNLEAQGHIVFENDKAYIPLRRN